MMHIPCDEQASAVFIRWCWIKACEKPSFDIESLHVSCVEEFGQNPSAHDKCFTSVILLCCRHSAEVSVQVKGRRWSHKRCFNVQNTHTHINVPDCCWSGWYWFCVWVSSFVGTFGQTDCNTPSWPEGGNRLNKLYLT